MHINNIDLPGRRFNGCDLQKVLNANNIESKQFVMEKLGDDINVIPIVETQLSNVIRKKCIELEDKLSIQSQIYPFGEIIGEHQDFKTADIVHYHLIFNHFMSLTTFKKLVKMKKSVWTIHDPWAMTGHCVYPVECNKWLEGCKECPNLDRYSPLRVDNSSVNWNIKKSIYEDLDLDIIVASQWMYNLVKKSPLMKNFKKIHIVPFGIDLDIFKNVENKKEVRIKNQIPTDNFVIMFREDPQEWKGLEEIKNMLRKLNPAIPVTILTVGGTGLLKEFEGKYDIREYGWVNDDNLMAKLYSMTDLFLMPSVAEAFGLMAIEAMASSIPIIVLEGTSLPSVTFAPEYGIAVQRGEAENFVAHVERLILNPHECRRRGKLGRELAEKHYDVNKYNKRMIQLYKEIYGRK